MIVTYVYPTKLTSSTIKIPPLPLRVQPPGCDRRALTNDRSHLAGDRLRSPGLGSLEWALALEEGWEKRYTRVLESGDGWAAMFLHSR